MNQDVERVLFTEEELHKRVKEIGRELTKEYQGKRPVLLCVMKGSLVFTADLMREIDLPLTLEYISLSSYRNVSTRPGEISLREPFELDVRGRDIIVVEDILDTGRTLNYVLKLMQGREPASLQLVVLLDKPSRREAKIEADKVGFTIPDYFVVGYGLDYNQHYRNLPYIGVLRSEIYSSQA